MRKTSVLLATTASIAMAGSAFANEPTFNTVVDKPIDGFKVGDTNVTFGGYIKLDMFWTHTPDGEIASESIGRDFYLASVTPVGGDNDNPPTLDFSPRESRFRFGLDTKQGEKKLGGMIEFDFLITNDGDERISNSYSPRMRRAYITYGDWLLGQEWSTFQNLAAWTDNLDFIGPTESSILIRQPQIRYQRGAFKIALEQPETTIATPTGRVRPGDDFAPDVVARYDWNGDWGTASASAVVRALRLNDAMGLSTPASEGDTTLGYGVSFAGKVKAAGKDDIRFTATVGEGVGRYVGLNYNNDAFVNADGSLEAIAVYAGYVSYRHIWSPTLRSAFTAGYHGADAPMRRTRRASPSMRPATPDTSISSPARPRRSTMALNTSTDIAKRPQT